MYTQLSSILTKCWFTNHAAVAVVGLGCIEPPKRCTLDGLKYFALPVSARFSRLEFFFLLLCSLNRPLLVLSCSSMSATVSVILLTSFSGVFATNLHTIMPFPRAVCPCQLTFHDYSRCAMVLSNNFNTKYHVNDIMPHKVSILIIATVTQLRLTLNHLTCLHFEMAPAILKSYL